MNLSASEQLACSTVRIECEYSDNSTGTGTKMVNQMTKIIFRDFSVTLRIFGGYIQMMMLIYVQCQLHLL
jgi:hypothetical protein